MFFRLLLVVMLSGFCQPPAMAQTTPGASDAPHASASIPLHSGSVDAVDGRLHLGFRLGPVLPGRIPMGFNWRLSTQSGESYKLGGSLRPVEWPDLQTIPATITVKVGGEDMTFFPTPLSTATALPNSSQLHQWLDQRQVNMAEIPDFGDPEPPPYLVVEKLYPSSDGTRFYLEAHWERGAYRDPDGTLIRKLVKPKRAVVLSGDMAVWTVFDGVTHITDRWGNHISATERKSTWGWPDQITIKNEKFPTQTITMNTSVTVKAWWDDRKGVVDSDATLSITNTLGLPEVNASGSFRTRQWTSPSSSGPVPMGIFSVGFLPTAITEGGARTTSLTWPKQESLAPIRNAKNPLEIFQAYTGPVGIPETVSYPSGAQETFSYSMGYALGAYSFSNGRWAGWKATKEREVPPSLPTTPGEEIRYSVKTVTTNEPGGVGHCAVIAKVWPKANFGWDFNETAYTEPRHLTYILTYPSTTPQGAYRALRITHASGGTWPMGVAPDPLDKRTFAFASSMISRQDAFTGSGAPGTTENWEPSSVTPYATTLLDGYDLRSWANPNGVLGTRNTSGVVTYAPTPSAVALRTRARTENLPVKIRVAGNPNIAGSRDAYGPILTEEATLPPGSWTEDMATWSESLGSASLAGDILRTGRLSRTWNADLMALQVNTETNALGGTQLASLRGVASVDFGTTTYTYDSLGRVTETQGFRNPATSFDKRTYHGNTPHVATIRKSIQGVTVAHPELAVGQDFEYFLDTAHEGLSSEKNYPDGRATTYLRDALGRETLITDPNGVSVTTDYDSWGRVWTKTGGGLSTTITYDVNGLWKQESVAGEGRTLVTRTDFDAAGRVVKTTLPDGSTQTTLYDGFGQKTDQSPVLRPGISFTGKNHWNYDLRGRLTGTTDAQGRTLSTVTGQPAWGSLSGESRPGILTTVADDRGYSRSELIDLLGQKIAVQDQKAQLTRYFYDGDGHLNSSDQGGQVRSYTYNSLGWLTDRTEPEEGQTVFSNHTLLGTPLTAAQKGRSGGSSVITTTVLNGWGLPWTITQGAYTRTMGYDTTTHLPNSMTEAQPNGTLSETYGYDALARQNSKTMSDGSQSFTISRVLDAFGNVKSISYPGGGGRASQAVTYDFDAQNRPWTVSIAGTQRAQMVYGTGSGNAVTDVLMYSNGTTTSSRTDRGELVNVTHGVASGLSGNAQSNDITWTAGGLMLSRGSDTFTYDELQRLSGCTVQGLDTGESITQTFLYDRWGNRTNSGYTYSGPSKPEEVLAWTATYDARNSLPTTVNTPAGVLGTGATYDDLGRLTAVQAVPNNTAAYTTQWGYDPSGRVVTERVAGITSNFLLDGGGRRFRRITDVGKSLYTVYGFNGEPLMMLEKASPSASLTWKQSSVFGFGTLISEEKSTGTFWMQGDQVGSPNIITNTSGAVVGRSKNLPFGERFGQTGEKSARRYTNHEYQEGCAIYMQARTYLPAYGKFAQVDPAYDQTKDDPESWNLYNYVTNNPVTHTDPDGREPIGQNSFHPLVLIDGFDWGDSSLLMSGAIQDRYYLSGSFGPQVQWNALPGSGRGVERQAPSVHLIQKNPVTGAWEDKGSADSNVLIWVINGMMNKFDDAIRVMADKVSAASPSANAFNLIHNPTEGFVADLMETLRDKFGQTTDVAKLVAAKMMEAQQSGKAAIWIGHSQGGAILAEAVRYVTKTGGGSLVNQTAVFFGGANNRWMTNSILRKAGVGNGGYLDHPLDIVPNLAGLNTFSPAQLLLSIVTTPLLFTRWSHHTWAYTGR